MTGAMTIACHEIARRWLVWIAAIALGTVPVILLASQNLSATHHAGELFTFALVVTSWAASFGIGMTTIGRPLHNNQLAFYFTRPIHGLWIAAGKIAGGLVIVAGLEMLVMIPAMVDEGTDSNRGFVILACMGLGCAFFAAGLVVGVLARSRSRWFVLDAIGGGIVTLIAILMFDRINDVEMLYRFVTYDEGHWVFARAEHLLVTLVGAAAVSMMLAVAVGIAVGRTDRVRVHAALSITLWSCLTATALAGLAFATWGFQ